MPILMVDLTEKIIKIILILEVMLLFYWSWFYVFFYEGTSDIKTQEYGESINFLTEGISSIISKIKELLSLGYNSSDILVLCPKLFQAQHIYENLGNLALKAKWGKEMIDDKLILKK